MRKSAGKTQRAAVAGLRLTAVLAVAAAVSAALLWQANRADPDGQPIGLFTTLPILWNETGSIAAQLNDRQEPHWARAAIAAGGHLTPLDVLAAPGGSGPLDGLTRLVLAQPRPLSAQENVALDGWVRGGGRLLLLADPALTEESLFPLGDRRRPQSTVLLSPILRRWGLELLYDEAQTYPREPVALDGMALPVALTGRFALLPGAQCRLLANQIVAICGIGKGRVVAVADAALIERDDPDGAGRQALERLVSLTFSDD